MVIYQLLLFCPSPGDVCFACLELHNLFAHHSRIAVQQYFWTYLISALAFRTRNIDANISFSGKDCEIAFVEVACSAYIWSGFDQRTCEVNKHLKKQCINIIRSIKVIHIHFFSFPGTPTTCACIGKILKVKEYSEYCDLRAPYFYVLHRKYNSFIHFRFQWDVM